MAARLLVLAVAAVASGQVTDPLEAGIAALEKNDLGKAQAVFQQATRSAPENAKAWLLLAQTYARQKNLQPSIAAAEKAETLGAGDPSILQGLANLYATLLADPPRAAALGEKYAERAPSRPNRLAAAGGVLPGHGPAGTGHPRRDPGARGREHGRDAQPARQGLRGT